MCMGGIKKNPGVCGFIASSEKFFVGELFAGLVC